MKQGSIFLLILVILLLSGCSSIPENWNGTNRGGGSTQTARVTQNYPLKWVDEAVIEVLDQMEIMIVEDSISSDGKSIQAATLNQDITIKLKPVTPSSTLMQIDITETDREEHASLGHEIMNRTEKYLLDNSKIDTTSFAEGFGFNKESLPAK